MLAERVQPTSMLLTRWISYSCTHIITSMVPVVVERTDYGINLIYKIEASYLFLFSITLHAFLQPTWSTQDQACRRGCVHVWVRSKYSGRSHRLRTRHTSPWQGHFCLYYIIFQSLKTAENVLTVQDSYVSGMKELLQVRLSRQKHHVVKKIL